MGSEDPTNILETTNIGISKITKACNPKNGYQNLWGNIVYWFPVKELDVIVQKILSLYNDIKF